MFNFKVGDKVIESNEYVKQGVFNRKPHSGTITEIENTFVAIKLDTTTPEQLIFPRKLFSTTFELIEKQKVNLIEEFRIKNNLENMENFTVKGWEGSKFWVGNNYIYALDDGENKEGYYIGQEALCDLLSGNVTIVKKEKEYKPFIPKEEELYYYFNLNVTNVNYLRIERSSFTSKGYCCMIDVLIGNCFRSEAEAEEHKDLFDKTIKEVYNEVVNND